MNQVRHKIFGKDSWTTIYYFTGYGTTIKKFSPHILTLVAASYRVVAFEYNKTVLFSGDPNTLVSSLDEVESEIKIDIAGREIAGVYGSSLGTWYAENIMNHFHIERGVYNSAGCSVPGAIWNRPMMQKEKALYKKNGITRDDLEKCWQPYNVMLEENKFRNKKLIVMNTTADEVIDIIESRETMELWRSFGNEVEFIEIPRLKHSHSIMRNMLRVKKVTSFFAGN